MSFFNRGDVLDLPDLQRRGILKKQKELESAQTETTNGYVDFSNTPNEVKAEPPNSVEPAPSPFSFLDSLSNPSTASPPSYFAPPSSPTPTMDSSELQGLKNKLEDLEYKLDRLMEKIAKLEGS